MFFNSLKISDLIKKKNVLSSMSYTSMKNMDDDCSRGNSVDYMKDKRLNICSTIFTRKIVDEGFKIKKKTLKTQIIIFYKIIYQLKADAVC